MHADGSVPSSSPAFVQTAAPTAKKPRGRQRQAIVFFRRTARPSCSCLSCRSAQCSRLTQSRPPQTIDTAKKTTTSVPRIELTGRGENPPTVCARRFAIALDGHSLYFCTGAGGGARRQSQNVTSGSLSLDLDQAGRGPGSVRGGIERGQTRLPPSCKAADAWPASGEMEGVKHLDFLVALSNRNLS